MYLKLKQLCEGALFQEVRLSQSLSQSAPVKNALLRPQLLERKMKEARGWRRAIGHSVCLGEWQEVGERKDEAGAEVFRG